MVFWLLRVRIFNLFHSFFPSSLEKMGGFFDISCSEITHSIISSTKIRAFFFNKVVSSTKSEFSFDFLLFSYVFFVDLLRFVVVVSLFIGFYVGDSDDNIASIRQKSHIKSLLVSMLHQTWNLRYSRHIRIIFCVAFELFLITINLDAMSFSNVFNSLNMCHSL